tara:strand:- start:320 stop:640 length:321 start_codon:yes stop_codon:yes gene_type:complete
LGSGRPGEKCGGVGHIGLISITTGFKFAGFHKGNSRDFSKKKIQHGRDQKEPGPTGRLISKGDITEPEDPFEEIIRMAGVPPEPGVTNLFSGPFRVGLKNAKLFIG